VISGHLGIAATGRELVATPIIVNAADLLGAYNTAAVDDIIILNPGTTAYTGVSCTGTASYAATSLCMKKAVTIKCSSSTSTCTLDGLNARRVAIVESGNASIMKFENLIFTKGKVSVSSQ
jgi:hypothetical protein